MRDTAVQMKGFSLAGLMYANVNLQNLKKSEAQSGIQLAKVSRQNLAKLSHNLTKPDIETLSKYGAHSAKNSAEWLSKVDIVLGKITTNCDVENQSKPDIRPAARAGFVLGDEVGDVPGAALVAQQADQSSATSGLGVRRCSSVRATLTNCWISSPAFAPISSMRVSASLAIRSADSAPPFNWRRAISPRIAVTMKLALLSPSLLTDAISSKTSCGTRAFICWDLLLVELVDIDSILPESVIQHTQKVNRTKELWCDSLSCIVNTTLSTGKAQVPHKKARPGSALTLTGPLTTSVTRLTR